jgi:hypothetical protein
VRITVLTSILVLFAAIGQAQTRESKATLSAIGGFGKTFDDEGSLGSGWLAGAAVDRVVFGTTRAELSIEVLTHDRDSGYFLSNGQTTIGGLSLVHRFGRGAAQPYVFGGLTAGHHSGTNTFSGLPVELSNTSPGFRTGFGVAIRSGGRLEISPEIRLNEFFIDDDSDPAMLFSFGIRIGLRL